MYFHRIIRENYEIKKVVQNIDVVMFETRTTLQELGIESINDTKKIEERFPLNDKITKVKAFLDKSTFDAVELQIYFKVQDIENLNYVEQYILENFYYFCQNNFNNK